jgi:hypothetical protein
MAWQKSILNAKKPKTKFKDESDIPEHFPSHVTCETSQGLEGGMMDRCEENTKY